MSEMIFAIGDIVRVKESDVRYRIIGIVDDICILCEMDTTKLIILEYYTFVLVEMLAQEKVILEKEPVIVFDVNSLSKSIKEKFENKRNMIREVIQIYGPTFEGLRGKHSKPEIQELMNKYGIKKNTFWRTCTGYLQSGMQDVVLIDNMAFGVNKGKTYSFESKSGRKSIYIENAGVVLDEVVLAHFEEALKDYKSGREKTIRTAFDNMNNRHYSRTEIMDGVVGYSLVGKSERPTFWQFYHYVRNHLTSQEKDLIKTSAAEQRNDKRLLLSDSLDGVDGPGDMIEIDAWEANVSLVSSSNRNETVGKPVVYMMIDVYSRAILAVSVAFDNNSVLGITNLFLNLGEDKHKFCRKYGVDFENDRIWPSGIIPRRIRLDRGAECKSKEFDRICVELGIEKQLLPGATGSLKGVVEQSFNQMLKRQRPHLEHYGLVVKRHDSKHHKEASLTIEEYTALVINFVFYHNQKHFPKYPLTREMIEQDLKAIPALLWEFGVKKYGHPRPIISKEQYSYDFMTPIKAKVSRKGISYKGLWYFSKEDDQLLNDMFDAGIKMVHFNARMDMRDVGYLYYLRDGKLIEALLNDRITGNADYKGLTMKQYDEIRKKRGKLNAEGQFHNEKLAANNYAVNETIVKAAKKSMLSDDSEIRIARAAEKQRVSNAGRIRNRLLEEEIIVSGEEVPVPIEETYDTNNSNADDVIETKKYVPKYTDFKDAIRASNRRKR